jgi:hypothetical protein
MMKHLALFLILAATGCSNAPLAGTLDCLFPSKVGKHGPVNPRPDESLPPPNLPTRPEDPLPPRGSLDSNPRDRKDDKWKPLDRPETSGLGEPLPAPLPAPGYLDK